ncbi:MAG TPA: ABC transporter ATP-binding protein [Pyrodictium sp.]|nr:ABC transporter ATP-binding protein [Pyrodictium sp.]
MIVVERLWAGYKPGKPVVKDVSFRVGVGEILAIVGPNGAGKSTILRCLAGFIKPLKGRILVAGLDPSKTPAKTLAKIIGYVAPDVKAPPLLTVLEFVMLGRLAPRGSWKVDSEDIEVSYETLALLGIEHLAEKRLDELSTGQRQLVLLAQALAKKPRILLLDEPTASLDLKRQHDTMQLIYDLTKEQGISTVVVHHDLNLAIDYSDKVLVLNNGKVKAYGAPEEVLSSKLVQEVYGVEAKLVVVDGLLRIITLTNRSCRRGLQDAKLETRGPRN